MAYFRFSWDPQHFSNRGCTGRTDTGTCASAVPLLDTFTDTIYEPGTLALLGYTPAIERSGRAAVVVNPVVEEPLQIFTAGLLKHLLEAGACRV